MELALQQPSCAMVTQWQLCPAAVLMDYVALQVVGASSSPQQHSSSGQPGNGSSSWPLYLQLSTGDEVGVDLLVQAIGVEPSTAWLPGEQGGRAAAASWRD
jgi:hypothetical protein